jgi:raffinose/stachyose/melibiose transport system substrate-binding protein
MTKSTAVVLICAIGLLVATAIAFASPAQESAGAKKTSITLWYQANDADPTDPKTEWLKTNLDTFAAKHPEITVNKTVVSDGDQYLNKISTAIAAGAAPDMFQTWLSGRLQPFVEAGRVYALDDALAKDPNFAKYINRAYLDTATFGGKIYALPSILSGEVVFYNKEVFDKAGLKPAKTWDELMAMIAKFRAGGIVPFGLANKSPWVGSMDYMAIFDRINGPDKYKRVVFEHKAEWDDSAYAEAGSRLQDLVKAGAYPENFNGLERAEGRALFTAGKAAMHFMGTWDVALLLQKLGDKLAFANFPDIPGGKGSAEKGWIMNKDEGYAISAGSDKKDAALLLLKHFFSPERQGPRAEKGILIAAVNVPYDASKVPAVTSDILKTFAGAQYGITPWDNPLGVSIGKEFNLTTQAILGGADPKKAFAQLQSVAAVEWKK